MTSSSWIPDPNPKPNPHPNPTPNANPNPNPNPNPSPKPPFNLVVVETLCLAALVVAAEGGLG